MLHRKDKKIISQPTEMSILKLCNRPLGRSKVAVVRGFTPLEKNIIIEAYASIGCTESS